jgi:hypothetical protein
VVLLYVRLGLAVFPVRPLTKRPLTKHGHLDAASEVSVVENWWHRWPEAGVGIACRPSGIAVLDVDPRHGGDDTLADLQRQHGLLSATWRSLTGGGGLHVIFRSPADMVLVDGAIAPGIDLKANGYIVAPPSQHPSGRRYAWECGYEPGSLCLAPLPGWVLDHFRCRASDRLRRDGTPLVIPEGQRNRRLFQLASMLRRYGLNERAILECVTVINRQHAVPPLPDSDLRAIAKSASRYPAAATVPDLSRAASHTHVVRVR